MIKDKTVAVVVPAYNEENQIVDVLQTMPDFVDRIVVVNDMSTDNTAKIVKEYMSKDTSPATLLNHKPKLQPSRFNKADQIVEKLEDEEKKRFLKSEEVIPNYGESRIILINHLEKGIVGGAIATGYKWCKDHSIDCTAVMAGDGQMDPSELEGICMPVINDEVDYVKANRLSHRSAYFVIPKIRFFGNSILSLFTKIASGYWKISDTQNGYTAIGLKALKAIRLYEIYKNYGCPNDILVKLNIAFCSIREIQSKPIYNVGEKSKMKELHAIPRISWLLFKSFWKRLYVKYLFRDFHPLFLLYHLSFVLFLLNIPTSINIIRSYFGYIISTRSFISFVFLSISSFQTLFFAMWMDMMDNERLYK
ncbi:MAG: glycosyl transferase family 2 [uncultured bacterium]|nr:MAG: glycosyl transferase family 2 [uncultured bacterium]